MLELKESEYVMAAKALGTPTLKIVTRHLIPNTMSIIIVQTTFSIPSFIFSGGFLKLHRNGYPAAAHQLGRYGFPGTAADGLLSS
ncbi:MAG: ABC transporter permease subunit [Lachnospiraceae bacterium]